MTIKERKVTEAQIGEIVGLIQDEEAMISLDRNDVRSVFVGKEGTLYEACQEKGVSNSDFMKDFFGALRAKDDV